MRLVWAVIPLILIVSIIGIDESFAQESTCSFENDVPLSQEYFVNDLVVVEFLKLYPGSEYLSDNAWDEPLPAETYAKYTFKDLQLVFQILEYNPENTQECYFINGYKLFNQNTPNRNELSFQKDPIAIIELLNTIKPLARNGPLNELKLDGNYNFVDFSYANIIGDPIKFILEKTSYSDCNSYNAKIIDEDENPVWEEGTFALCDPPNTILITSQIKIGYNEDNPIIINESGKYYLEVEVDNIFTKREFVVRQNHGGGTLDRTVYPIPFDMPSPHKQMELGIKLGHIICDKDKVPVWNTHYKPACVFSDTESELLSRGWAKLRLMLPASPFPEKEMEWTGRNVMSMMLEGTFSYSSTSVETLDDKRKAIEEYSKQYHQGEQYLEYAITPYQYHYNVGDKVQFELLEWGISSDCSNPQLRIIDINDQSMFESNFDKLCIDHDGTYGTFNSYSIGDDFEEFVCDKTGYYRIEVSNGDIFPPTILQNFACLDYEPELMKITPEPEPAPFPSKCKSGPAPSDDYYFDEDTCDWKEIENEN